MNDTNIDSHNPIFKELHIITLCPLPQLFLITLFTTTVVAGSCDIV
jgi:hypothetical protein